MYLFVRGLVTMARIGAVVYIWPLHSSDPDRSVVCPIHFSICYRLLWCWYVLFWCPERTHTTIEVERPFYSVYPLAVVDTLWHVVPYSCTILYVLTCWMQEMGRGGIVCLWPIGRTQYIHICSCIYILILYTVFEIGFSHTRHIVWPTFCLCLL